MPEMLATQEPEIGGSEFKAKKGKKARKPYLQKTSCA
jgi:hypothetical protein